MHRPTRWEYRVALSDVDRGVTLDRRVVLSQHPSETTEHLVLRALAFCLFVDESSELEFGPGVCVGDAPDIQGRDLTGGLGLWVGCGDVAPELARKVVQHNRDAAVEIVFDDPDKRATFEGKVGHWPKRPRGWPNLRVWLLPRTVVEGLAAIEEVRQRWSVTIVGEHLYVDAAGFSFDGEIETRRP